MGLFTHDILDSHRTDVQPPGFFIVPKKLESSWELWEDLQKRTGYLIIHLGAGVRKMSTYNTDFLKNDQTLHLYFFQRCCKKYGQVIWSTLHLTTPQIIFHAGNTCVSICPEECSSQGRWYKTCLHLP